MNRIYTHLLIAVAALSIAAAPTAYAIGGCGNNYLVGTYGGALSEPGTSGDVATSYQQIYFDGKGGLQDKAFGTPNPIVVGSYSVSTDCSVAITINAGTKSITDLLDGKYTGIAVRGGAQMFVLKNGKGSRSGLLSRGRNSCTNSDMNGSYAYLIGDPAKSITQTGYFTVDGAGNVVSANNNASDEDHSGSVKSSNIVSGSYSISADCSVRVAFVSINLDTNKEVTNTLRGVVVQDGNEMFVTSAFGSKKVTGSVVRQ